MGNGVADCDAVTLIEWAGLRFTLPPSVFAPRHSSLALIDFAAQLEWLANRPTPVPLIDMCCGCGALGIALFERLPSRFASLTLLDASVEAVAAAEANRRRHGIPGSARRWRAGEPLPPVEGPALILCNPPFLTFEDAEDLPGWERECVVAGERGLAVLRACLRSAGAGAHHVVLKSEAAQLPAAALFADELELSGVRQEDAAFSYWQPRVSEADPPVGPPSFGVELEFFLLDDRGEPALRSTARVIAEWRARGGAPHLVPELGSFQIELNPGPWPLNAEGIDEALIALADDVAELERCAAACGYSLSAAPIPPQLSEAMMCDAALLADDPRSRATSRHFERSAAVAEFDDGGRFVFPGERVLACLNEIHIHVRLANDAATIALFDRFNREGEAIVRPFQAPITLNGRTLRHNCTTMRLFEQADGELSADGGLRRVGFLPNTVDSLDAYRSAVARFDAIPWDENDPPFLDLERSVWFWARLRGRPGALRLEFRPMDMGPDWAARVRHLAETARNFGALPHIRSEPPPAGSSAP